MRKRRRVTLADGLRLLIRPISAADREELHAAFHRLSPESRRLRFLIPPGDLSEAMLTYLTVVDGTTHAALVAQAVAIPGAPGVGLARYVKLDDEPEAAELAVTVLDEYQSRGIGTCLLEAITELAVANGVRRFCAYVDAGNPILELAQAAGATITPEGAGVVRVSVELPLDAALVRGSPLWKTIASMTGTPRTQLLPAPPAEALAGGTPVGTSPLTGG